MTNQSAVDPLSAIRKLGYENEGDLVDTGCDNAEVLEVRV